MLADVNVIDFEGLDLDPLEVVYDLPTGGRRLVRRGRGHLATIKSGVVVSEDDQPSGERPGRPLRGARAHAA